MRNIVDRNVVLDLWGAGVAGADIAFRLGITRDHVTKIASLARKAGDPRAVRRANFGQMVAKAQMHTALLRRNRMRRLARFAVTADELDRAVARYSGPVTRLHPGFHAGHIPACLKALNY